VFPGLLLIFLRHRRRSWNLALRSRDTPQTAPERVLWEEKRREDELRSLDIRVVRIADADLGGGWPRTESRLRTLLAAPGPSRRLFTATPGARGPPLRVKLTL